MPKSRQRKKVTTPKAAQKLTPEEQIGVQAFVRAYPKKMSRQDRETFAWLVLVGITPDEVTVSPDGHVLMEPSAIAKIKAVPELAAALPHMREMGMILDVIGGRP